jgi:trimeric autotransporter adhesin
MSSTKQKLRLAGAFATLAIFAIGVGCTGFFVNPTVASITIDPSDPTVSVGLTQQMSAAGTDSNGNALTLTAGTSCTGTTVCWSSATPSVATISTGGLVTGVSAGTSTITASSGTATATTTATITLGNVTSISLDPTSISLPVSSTATGSQCIYAYALAGGQKIDVSATVTWQTGNSSLITVENGQDPMCPQSSSTAGSTTIFATYVSGTTTITSPSASVTVGGS